MTESTATATETLVPADAGSFPDDIADEPGDVAGFEIDRAAHEGAQPEPLPNLSGMTAADMERHLSALSTASAGALGNWSQAGGAAGGSHYFGRTRDGKTFFFDGKPTPAQAAEKGVSRVFIVEGRPANDPADHAEALVKAESTALDAARTLERNARAIMAATERPPVRLPDEAEVRVAETFALVAGQVDRLPLPALADRVRAAVVADDVASLSIYADTIEGRLAGAPDTANVRDHEAKRDLGHLAAQIRSDLSRRFADPATVALREKAAAALHAANEARHKAGKRRRTAETLQRAGDAYRRQTGERLLVPVRDADGRPIPAGEGGVAMKRYDESDDAYRERTKVERDREEFGRNVGTLVLDPSKWAPR